MHFYHNTHIEGSNLSLNKNHEQNLITNNSQKISGILNL
jgi:hypothetical protein